MAARSVYTDGSDIARTSAFRYALGYVDGLAREYDVDREELRVYAQANCRGLHGISRAFGVFEYMYGRSDNGGESEARAAMILAGVVAPELQVEIDRPGNVCYYLADYGWQMPDGSWMLAELHGLGKFEDETQKDSEHAAAKTYRAALLRDANLRAMGHNVIHFKLSDTYDQPSICCGEIRTVEAFKGMKQSVFHRNLGGDGVSCGIGGGVCRWWRRCRGRGRRCRDCGLRRRFGVYGGNRSCLG